MAETGWDGNGSPGARVVYWAAARVAAGTHEEACATGPLVEVLAAVRAAHPAITPILDRCLLLLDGVRIRHDDDVEVTGVLEVLPPFAGGSHARSVR